MKSNISEVYDDLSVLLKDICQFLNDEVKQLSPKAATRASELINRSKTKLQEISKLLPPDDDSYMDMKPIIVPAENIAEYFDADDQPKTEEVPEIYSDIDGKEVEETESNLTCPHDALPAKMLPREKYGYIERKEKFLFIEHYKKLYAGIIDEWMLLYCSEKDTKPFETHHLKQYEAKEIEKKEAAFELSPKTSSSRTYYFAASTKKDMLQWVSIINRKSNKKCYVPSKPLPKTPNQNDAKTKDDMEIYEELANDEDRDTKIKLSTLPKTNHLTRKLPASPEENYDFLDSPDDDIYDQITGSTSLGNGIPNDIDTEEIYDTITPISEHEPEETYDTIQRPSTKTKPETPEKPKINFILKSRK